MKQLRFAFILLAVIVSVRGFAQTTVKGHIINERGDSVEYVSIGIKEDSVGVISDAQGQFTLTIPAGRKDELTFTHLSYQTTTIPYATYSDGHELTVTLKDKVVELPDDYRERLSSRITIKQYRVSADFIRNTRKELKNCAILVQSFP